MNKLVMKIFCGLGLLTTLVYGPACLAKKKIIKPTESPAPIEAPTQEATPPVAPPLDLSLPDNHHTLSAIDPVAPDTDKNKIYESFLNQPANKKRSVQVDGRWLTTQELEQEKNRVVDGAGLVIRMQR